LADAFGYPMIVVAANELGTINATLQTLIAATTYGEGLSIAGVVLNSARSPEDDPSVDSNPDEISRRCVPPLLTLVEHAGGFDRTVDWASLSSAGRKSTR
jgi:dethiobiotin synthetase